MAWDDLDLEKFLDERQAARALLAAVPLSTSERQTVAREAEALVRDARGAISRAGVVQRFLQEFSLSTQEGLALMCLAEALLRTPDTTTRDRLIAERIASADWSSHIGRSDSLLVNASTWSLMLTGRLVDPDPEMRRDLPSFVRRLAGRVGEPVIRAAVAAALRIMGEQFVLGRSIEQALRRAAAEGLVCSFDMLGEGARTEADAERYEAAYAGALERVAQENRRLGPDRRHGLSVKLSALSPRYDALHEVQVFDGLYPRLKRLARQAADSQTVLTIDAEEADRLVLSLKLLSRLAASPALSGWSGLGLAVQAYQKRAPRVIAAVNDLAQESGRSLHVRLVKGAYWDAEIKRAQVAGQPGYPVFTTKAATDLSNLVCARALLAAGPSLRPQFATHNAHTVAAVRAMAEQAGSTPVFQRLHGMGETLYEAATARYGPLPVQVYAPVGEHEQLLPYLVRRLLENGANTSFVHALSDPNAPAAAVAADPIALVEASGGAPHPGIPLPADLFQPDRANSTGVDLTQAAERERLVRAIIELDRSLESAGPIVSGRERRTGAGGQRSSPADPHRVVASTWSASAEDIQAAFAAAAGAQPAWDAQGGAARARVLRAMAAALEHDRDHLVALCVREAGKTLADGVAEVREAADFCRYYAMLAERQFDAPVTLKGPTGETNTLRLKGRGVFACISPWNFPLAIFTGQVAAALAAGDAVLAKPAEQTPVIAAAAVRLFHAAGLPVDILHLLPGDGGVVGQALVQHPLCAGVAFTGGTQTAWAINRALAARAGPIVPLIAETGGLNAMFVDTTALREQVIDDVLVSAFGSAGQRCSALRLLFVPHETADGLISGIAEAMDALVVGDPADPATDIGPVIDQEALAALHAHLARLEAQAKVIRRLATPHAGTFFGPTLVEIPDAVFLQSEVFGPILHVVRYDPAQIAAAAAPLVAAGYGLTLGVHSRLDGFAAQVLASVPAGNAYVNRSIIGAVVGVQPFGGEGLSGTGPKAGGPNSLLRYAVERALSVNIAAQGGDPGLLNLDP
ncbi:bifunctional proline dehydrogenase/L-glutamate gamma-semialdehyde dehydrogenase PutA [Phenylobacterium sp.]|uniref:bifunctional proline dehydrogenase/L-glutamate gamma-semialdehyde dehydrogenase PutA n=1 Tax=Phenylobacterium sp. TaxID=1871053 RepID=UPI0027366E10|nr:bifunctional proline dehydrogenase/L-glutamate gamma-semialdehyde dehydrogenase PutA [Phenylobacterium sp.]MDP3659449.1 bifunctional proline dehydrogenase/L-glutamate gamma-semialdehyde dehydrogenase PutA [Phenylobacterium sp.]